LQPRSSRLCLGLRKGTVGLMAIVGEIFSALDWASGLLLAGALAVITLTYKEMRAARIALAVGAAIAILRWLMWSYTTDAPWLARAGIGAVIGALILGGLPPLWRLALERASQSPAPSQTVEPSPIAGRAPLPQPAPPSSPPIVKAPAIEAPISSPLAAVPEPIPKPKNEAPATPSKETIDVTPEVLVGLFDGNTALRAQTLVAEKIGKWIIVSGPLGEIFPGTVYGSSRSPTLLTLSSPTKFYLYMWFSGEWVDRLALLSKNQHISVLGQIKNVERQKVELENCELVDSTVK
jgi:hypothetical protein